MKKIYWDTDGHLGTVIGSDVLPIRDNEKLVCTAEEATALKIPEGKWISLSDVAVLDKINAKSVHEILSRSE